MVKGVSKTVIVVNNTGSRLFEKIVFYVTPEYGNLNAKQLKKAASSFSFNFQEEPKRKSIRKQQKKKKTIKIAVAVLLALAVVGVVLPVIL